MNAVTMTTGWEARLRLGYAHRECRTVVCDKLHSGPLVVQKALYPEGDGVCHSIMVHPPGGIAGGDRLKIDARLDSKAHVLFTTPGATRWYRSTGLAASQDVTLKVAAGAMVEWLPQETIYFDRTIARNSLQVDLTGDAGFIGWEIACLGRQRAGEMFEHGTVRQAMSIRVDGRVVFVERGQLSVRDVLLESAVGMKGDKVFATFVAHSGKCSAELLARCREVGVAVGMRSGLTLIGNTLVGRVLGNSSEQVRELLTNWWRIVREPVCGCEAVAPRIWRT